ncbi:programmed cell death protein 6 [Lingula anatina]|uniref:Peflin n=1 Tax=Lingula anatina TaxID=7574 RepID=A0A1S3IXN6_LINAN|nr:programmed cell death protein 6 [Lingula anatina]|eukprot:XP_013402793.1 programmed cell death protein 6 [Lingula anatina]
MSWGGTPHYGYGQAPPPQQQGYGQPYGQGPQGGQYRGQTPSSGQYGQAPGQYGQPPPGQYGQQPCQQYGAGYGYQQQQPGGAYGGGYPGGQPGGGGFGYGATPPPPGISPDLWQWFQAVDQDRSGQITASELQSALVNGNWTPFNKETCRLMIGMFDKDRSGTIGVQEFAALWKYIQDWKSCFDGFDADRSGNIDANELNNAFRTFGYNLSPQFCQLVTRVFDRSGRGVMKFDDFIQACVMLKSLTDKFRMKDTSQQGVIRIHYEEFLEMVLDNTLNRIS